MTPKIKALDKNKNIKTKRKKVKNIKTTKCKIKLTKNNNNQN